MYDNVAVVGPIELLQLEDMIEKGEPLECVTDEGGVCENI